MGTARIVFTIIYLIMPLLFLILGILQLLGKGPCLNNAYIYATKEQREKMYTRPYYIQTGVVFLLSFVALSVLAVSYILDKWWLDIFQIPIVIAILVYVFVSEKRIKNMKIYQ